MDNRRNRNIYKGLNISLNMEIHLLKPVVRMGNSAHVMLPREWINGRVRVELIQDPINIEKDVLQILKPHLKDILGIYLVGSYARGEQTKESDIDILVITNKKCDRINRGKYDILLISKENLEKNLKRNIMPLFPMIREAKPILNEQLINNYRNTEITKENIKWGIEITESSCRMQKEFLIISEEYNEKISDGIMYTIILGLRSVYIIDCLKKNRIPSTNGIRKLTKNLSGSEEPYEAYLRSKNEKSEKRIIEVENARSIYNYVQMEVKKL